jgi:hypothetical protein
MKHYLIAFSLVLGMIFLSCTGDDGAFLNDTAAIDSLSQEVDTAAVDSIHWESDTTWVTADSIYFPVDTTGTLIDSIVFSQPISMP